MNNAVLEAALKYQSQGFSVIPIRPDYDPEEKKFSKKPYIKWVDYQKHIATTDEIYSWWEKWPVAMIGIVTGEVSKLYAIDCDSEDSYQKVQSLLSDSFLTPTLVTPRGGHHLWVRCSNGARLRTLSAVMPDTDTRGDGGYIIAPPSTNEHGQTYQWLEGLSLDSIVIQELPDNIVMSLKGGVVVGGSSNPELLNTTQDYKDYKILQKGSRDADLFQIGMSLADGKYKREKLVQVLEILAKSCTPPFPMNELNVKIKSIFDRISTKDRNLSDEVREWCLLQKGYFITSAIRHELQITTKIDIKNLSVIINRLQADGIIEKHGSARGCYRTKEDTEKNEMVFIEEDIPEFNIKLPFGLNGIVSIYPKNIIIVAGSKSAGKTSILLQIALANQHLHDVVYLNSEMGDEEWSVRLKKLGIRKKDDMKFLARGVHNNFHDMMDGSKKIYLVDYLEIHENFFEIAKPIRKIHETLRDGICIIAVQKKQGELLARGGDFSMEKSRLYLSLDYLQEQLCTQVTIVDAKSPKVPTSIRGWSKRIKIIGGDRIEVVDKDWVF